MSNVIIDTQCPECFEKVQVEVHDDSTCVGAQLLKKIVPDSYEFRGQCLCKNGHIVAVNVTVTSEERNDDCL